MGLIEQGKEKIAEAARADAAELESMAREFAERPKPFKYVVGAFIAGLLVGALLTVGALGGLSGHELTSAPQIGQAR